MNSNGNGNLKAMQETIIESLETLNGLTPEETASWNWMAIAREAQVILRIAEERARQQFESVFGKAPSDPA